MTNKITNWRTWARGVVGAVIGGAANAITLMVVKPEDFNFAAGWGNLWHFALISGIVSAALYLKQHPVPEDDNATGPGATTAALLILCGLLALAPFGLTGCATLDATGPYHGDKALYIADRTDVAAYKTIHDFVLFEYENRAALASHPEIKAAADKLRQNAPDWFARYDQARALYTSVNTPETRAAFTAATDLLKSGLAEATKAILSAQSLVTK